ncbi:cytoskeletal protein CcmA (bactofilin family) [Paraperlucidibaca baekdonensis]|uniref:Cytoskeletal protein CcmA (Bactofilin family) n=1 Tax=Paraperlucidibaca baekdonensis TaxID=748120 RepID=A0A3E0H892_9GAMM|nr:polymer-forming cytoskeletal protein [Paraperlucidibaca baekdonensis]REH39813.1 cytoskeletal protein CcmA (bactofilin family) [Paraperlucidibaca baekdonensis]
MFKKSKNDPAAYKDHSFISRQSTVRGDLTFVGGLHVEGRIEGNIESKEGCLLVHGDVVGDIHVPNAIINGTVHGNITCSDHLELSKGARVCGVVTYLNMEMQLGAQVTGKMALVSAPVVESKAKPAPIEPAPAVQSDEKSRPAANVHAL